MEHDDFIFFKELTESFGPSGAENDVREIIKNKICSFPCEVTVDPLGNMIVKKGNGGDVVISAHMDEVAFTVMGYEDDGTLRFSQVGGISPANLPSKRVVFPERGIKGVIGAKPIHLNKKSTGETTYSDLFIDIGAQSKAQTRSLIQKGDLAVFDTKTEKLHSENSAFCGKAIDDRLGCFIMCKLICEPKITNCTFVFSVQEEVGLLGAAAFASNNFYRYGIALDVTTPNDLPEVLGPDKVCSLGKGPVISFADGRCVYNAAVISEIFKLLQENGISCQTKARRTGGNEAAPFMNEGCGMCAISISTPCRFIHGPVGVVWESDIESTEKAMHVILSKIQNGGFDHA